jgi:hypothetical protein
VLRSGIKPGPRPRCGGELAHKTTIRVVKGLETHFFQCEECEHIHTVSSLVRTPPLLARYVF